MMAEEMTCMLRVLSKPGANLCLIAFSIYNARLFYDLLSFPWRQRVSSETAERITDFS